MGKIDYSENKALKLINVLSHKINMTDQNMNIGLIIRKMENYIKTKGTNPIGPLVQHISSSIDEEGRMIANLELIIQCKDYINNTEEGYKMESVKRVPNCAYCRFTGPVDKQDLAYSKIRCEAFEEDIELKNESYIITLNEDAENEAVTIDVFIPKEQY